MKHILLAILLFCFCGCGLFKMQPPPEPKPPEEDGAEKVQRVLNSTIALAADFNEERFHFCSGVAVEGTFLTADHCVAHFFEEEYKDVKWYVFFKGEYFPGAVVSRWTSKDLALIDAIGAKVKDTVSVSPWEPTYGMRVIWTGFPLGFTSVHLFAGYVASPSSEAGDYVFDIDGQVIPGNSGGPVFDERGRLIGIAVGTALGNGPMVPEVMPVGQAVLPEYIRKALQ